MKRYSALVFLLMLLSCTEEDRHSEESFAGQEIVHALEDTSHALYWCPMDTHIVQEKPGICPICKMTLEPKPTAHVKDSISTDNNWVYAPVNSTVLSSIKTIRPVTKSIDIKLQASGYIAYDERRIRTISSKTSGRIERLYIKYQYQPIKKGQKLFELFSHELQTAQEEYLYLRRSDPGATELLNAAKNKLLLLGMTEAQMNLLHTSDHVHAITTIYSPFTGFVLEDNNSQPTYRSARATQDMSSTVTMGNNNQQFSSLREGSYVTKGEALFKVVNTDIVWAILEFYSNQVPALRNNQPVHLKLENSDELITGKISFIEPSYKAGSTGTVRARVYLDNKNQRFKIGTLVAAELEAGSKKGLWIPQSAMYDLGTDKIVFVKRNGAFETRKISIGHSSGNQVEVLQGLATTDEIAETAHFMVDSESFIKIKGIE